MLKAFDRWAHGPAAIVLAWTLCLAPGSHAAEPESAACAAATPASQPGTNCRSTNRPPVRVVNVPAPVPQGVGTLYNYVYCSPSPGGGASGAEGKSGTASGKDTDQCKDQSTKIEVEIKGVKLKVDTQNLWIAGSALILVLGFALLVFRAAGSGKTKSQDGEPASRERPFAALVVIPLIGFSVLAGFWVRGAVETALTDRQIRELRTNSDFSQAFDLASESTKRAERLQLRVAELEGQIAVARAGAPSNPVARPVDGTSGWLTSALVAALASLSVWSLLAGRIGSLRNARDRVTASVSAAMVSLEGALMRQGPEVDSMLNLRSAATSALEILRQARRGSLDSFE